MDTHRDEHRQLEHITTEVFADADAACEQVAQRIATLIRERAKAGKQAVLGLATGSTPVRLYQRLIQMHRNEGLSFQNVVTFNLDEYYGLTPEHPESYRRFMNEQLFSQVDIPEANTNIPSGMTPREQVFAACREYEDKIRSVGGIDIQLLGIGRTGHIGFNEPGSTPDSRTRLITLDRLTRADAARDFLGEHNVPRYAITMGIATILEAKEIYLLAWGNNKAGILARAVEGAQTSTVPASFLQHQKNVRFYIDTSASAGLTRFQHPWLVGSQVEWTPRLIRKAILWLSNTTQKPLLKLGEEDYSEHGLSDLLTHHGSAYDLNIRIFNEVQRGITGWPGGKPDADDSYRPERAEPKSKRCLVLSPEPISAELGMGGTIARLINQGHQVTLAHMTSGNLAVSDRDAIAAADFVLHVSSADAAVQQSVAQPQSLVASVREELHSKDEFSSDSADLRRFKGFQRRSEALNADQSFGLEQSQIRFLELPFYENGRYRRFKAGEADIERVATLLQELQPQQIYVTGDDADPSSLTAVSFSIFAAAYARLSNEPWVQNCRVWLYAENETVVEVYKIDMAVPLSPAELRDKVNALYHFQTQRSQSPSQHSNELWRISENINRNLADSYDKLGLADYEAIESFRRWHPQGDQAQAARK